MPATPPKLKPGGGASGLLPLASGTEAFVARMALTGQAQRTLDLQYYIWHGDRTGKLLAGAAVTAAERGVKVRLLLDDMGTAAKDRHLLILDSHPNIEVRLFNPISLRSARLLGTLLDFKRVNRRMHNKSFTVDGRVTIVGGRNIGDEYFGAADGMNFADFDVMARGPVVREVGNSFDLYWNDAASFPITQVSRKVLPAAESERGLQELLAHRGLMEQTPYAQAMRSSVLATTPYRELPLFRGRAEVVTDDPAKISTHPEDTSTHLAPQLGGIVEGTKNEVLLVSPYFVPGKAGVGWLAGLTRRGVAVKVITNSLASTDVAAVHAGYAKYRGQVLKAGVELHEMKPTLSDPQRKEAPAASPSTRPGSSTAGLHAKTFVFDRRWVFVGSMNLDPRSVKLNTELGIIVDCPELAREMIQGAEALLPGRAYRVELTSAGLQWTTKEQGQTIHLDSEPGAGFWKRLMWRVSALLPIEGQL